MITNHQEMKQYNKLVENMDFEHKELSNSLHEFLNGNDILLSKLVENYAHFYRVYIEYESAVRDLHENGRYPEIHAAYGYEIDDLRSAFFDLRDLFFKCILDEVVENKGEIQSEWIENLNEIDSSFELALNRITFREYLRVL